MSDESVETIELPGQLLRQARESAGLSVTDLAKAVRLQTSVIEALEANDYERLPGLPFVRGYLTNVQRKLGLPESAVLGVFDEWRGHAQPKPKSVAVTVQGEGDLVVPKEPMAGKVLVGLVLMSIVAWATVFDGFSHVVAWVSPVQEARDSNQLIVQPESVQPVQEQPVAELEETEAAAPVETSEAVTDTPQAIEAEVAQPAADVLLADTDVSIDLPSNQAAELPQDAPISAGLAPLDQPELSTVESQVSSPVPAEGHRLQMRFTGDSWIEITGADGRLVGDLMKREETVDLTGPGPFNVLVGNVTATQLTFDGQVIDLQSRARQNVARIQLP